MLSSRDLFSVIGYDPILPVTIEAPAAYSPADTKNLGRDSTVDDICDFIIEYIHSDVLVGTPPLLLSQHAFMILLSRAFFPTDFSS